jgi:hypothetical protein
MDRNKVFRFVRGLGLMLLPLACLAGLSAAFTGWAGVAALAKDHFIQLAILANLVIGFFLATLRQEESREKYGLQSYWATLIATGSFLPTALAVITVIIYLAGWAGKEGKYSLLWGSTIAVWVWFVAAFAFRWLADAEHAIPSSYGELRQRLTQLEAKLKGLCPDMDLNKPGTSPHAPKIMEAINQIIAIKDELKLPGFSWVLARGYDNVWNRLYRAEEALIEVAPEETVVAETLYDELRLQDSKIDNCGDLLNKLRQAVCVIDPAAKQYLKSSSAVTTLLEFRTTSPLPEGTVGENYNQPLLATGGTPPYSWTITGGETPPGLELDQKTGVLSGTPMEAKPLNFTVRVTDSASQMTEKPFTLTINSTAKTLAPPPLKTEPKTVARAVLRTVRRSINEYRGERWNGLIVARNRLLATMFFTAMIAYALFVIALICNADRGAVAAASTFYLVGATIGLLGRLRGESQTEAAVEDYGLSAARLITVPLLSGLAAIGGVVLMAMMPYASTVFVPPTRGPVAITQEEKSLQEAPGSDATKTPTGGLVPSTQQEQSTLAPQGAPGIKSPTKTPVPSSEQEKSSSGASDSRVTKPLVLPPVPSLSKIFDLGNNLIGLLVAAVFGLTPGLLFDRLQKLTEKYKSDLKSSQATQGAQKT